MITILGIMDKLYSDTKALTIVYFVGTGLLLLFIVMLTFSLRKGKETSKKEDGSLNDNTVENISLFDNNETNTKISEVESKPIVEDENQQKVVSLEENTEIKEQDGVLPKEEKSTEDSTSQSLIESTQKLSITPMTFTNEIEDKEQNIKTEEQDGVLSEEINENNSEQTNENKVKSNEVTVNTDIPDVDSFVDEVVNKVKDKNEQFSSVFVGDKTSTMKLDTILENLNVDDDIKDDITPTSEKTIIKDTDNNETAANIIDEKPVVSSLDDLKKSLDTKKEEITSKEAELKNKLNNLKNTLELPKINNDGK